MAILISIPSIGARLLAVPGQEDNFILYNYLVKEFVDDGWHNHGDFDRVLSSGQLVTGTDGKKWLKATGYNGDEPSFTGYVDYEDRNKTWYDIPTAITPPPDMPGGFVATAASSNQINLVWSNQSPTITEIERSTDASGSFSKIASPGQTATSYSDKNLLPNTLYFYRMRAVSSTGNSEYTPLTNAMTLAVDATPVPSTTKTSTTTTSTGSVPVTNLTSAGGNEAGGSWLSKNKVLFYALGGGLALLAVAYFVIKRK